MSITPTGAFVNMRGTVWKADRQAIRLQSMEDAQMSEVMERYLHFMRQSLMKTKSAQRRYVDLSSEAGPSSEQMGGSRGSRTPASRIPATPLSTTLARSSEATPGDAGGMAVPVTPRPGIPYEPVLSSPDGANRRVEAHPDEPQAQRPRRELPPNVYLQATLSDLSEGVWYGLDGAPLDIFPVEHPEESPQLSIKTPLDLSRLPSKWQRLFLEQSRPKKAATVVPSMVPLSVAEVQKLQPDEVVTSRWLDVWKERDSENRESWPKHLELPDHLGPKSRLIIQGFK